MDTLKIKVLVCRREGLKIYFIPPWTSAKKFTYQVFIPLLCILPLVYTCYCCSVAQLHLTLCKLMKCSTPGFPVPHYLLEFAHTQVHWVGDAIQPFQLLSPPSSALSLSQHQGLFQWVSSLHQMAEVLELQLQYWSFQWIFRVDFL